MVKPCRNEPRQQQGGKLNSLPRPLKYAWGVGVTLLLGLSLVLDRGSAWMPLVHQAIDMLQNQTAPIENR